jgi:Ni/Co efflux regulator RcnB
MGVLRGSYARGFRRVAAGDIPMKNILMISVATLALGLGATAALAQPNMDGQSEHRDTTTTTTVAAPMGNTTQTTTVTNNDGYKEYRRSVTVTHHYHEAAFVAPSGYTYTRYDLGQRVPMTLVAQPYELRYQTYGLQMPPAELAWVRVGNDALLVNRRDGEVVQTQYGIFTN